MGIDDARVERTLLSAAFDSVERTLLSAAFDSVERTLLCAAFDSGEHKLFQRSDYKPSDSGFSR